MRVNFRQIKPPEKPIMSFFSDEKDPRQERLERAYGGGREAAAHENVWDEFRSLLSFLSVSEEATAWDAGYEDEQRESKLF
jgi:hypothetical protein